MRLRAGTFACALILIAFSVARARAATTAEIESLGRPLPEDRVFYRWQSTASGEGLAKLGVMNEATNAHFMGLKLGVVAGPGVYMAESAHSSETYLPKAGGNLLEVRVKKGTLVIDVTDPVTVGRMQALGLDDVALTRHAHYPDGALIKYEGDYLVGKNLTGRASFELFPGSGRDAFEVRGLIAPITSEAAKNQAAAQILARRPDLARDIARAHPFDELALRLLPAADLPDHLARHALAIGSTAEVNGVYKLMRARPEVAEAVFQRPRAAAKILPKLMAGPLATDEALAQAPRVIKTALAQSTALTVDDQRRAVNELARTLLRDPAVTNDLPAHLPELKDLLGRGPLDARTRGLVASTANAVMSHLDLDAADLAPVRALLDAGSLHDSRARQRLDAIERQRANFARALKTRAVDDVARALGDQRDFAQFGATVTALRRAVPPATFDAAASRYFASRPPDFGAMFKDHRDWQTATAAAERDLGFDLLPRVYASAVDGPAAQRAWFFEPCLASERCAKFLLKELRADPKPFFSGIADLNVIAALLNQSHSPLAADLVRAVLPGLSAPQLTSFAGVFEGRAAFAPLFMARAEALGEGGLRASQTLRLARAFDRDTKGRQRLLESAITNVANPAEAEHVAMMLQGERAERALGRRLTARLATLGPTAAELDRFNTIKLASGPANVPTVPELDCLGRLARALDR